MISNIIVLFRSGIVLIFGLSVSLLFAGIKSTRKNNVATVLFCIILSAIQIISWQLFGLQTTMKLYPFITHFPIFLIIVLYFRRPWSIAASSVLAAYLCCQIPKWIGYLSAEIIGGRFTEHIAYLIVMCLVYYILKKYVADSVVQLTERSLRSCLLFGAVPLLYYLFDYATTVYTEILYTGARIAVQFTPSVLCTFYLLFVLLYYNESQKQAVAQRERDMFAAQFQNARTELYSLRQMQQNTVIYRHDMHHHLALLDRFAADGDLEKIKAYLASTEAAIDAMTPVKYCENETVNLILSSFIIKAKKADVTLHTNVDLPEELNINDTELCALLSNALENAITAAGKLNEDGLRKVYFHAVINDDKLVISTENAYEGIIEMDGDLPRSDKKEAGHGFGIKSMINISERYGGLYSFETEGGIFILRIMLPLNRVA